MYAVLIGIGLALLVGIAITLGMVIAGERMNRERSRIDAQRWELYFWEQEIVNTAELRGCRSCQLLRRRAELQRSPSSPDGPFGLNA